MNQTETTYSNNLKIKFIKDQIRENEYRGRIGNFRDCQYWYARANESLEKRILMYK